jgi:hypothetical protein
VACRWRAEAGAGNAHWAGNGAHPVANQLSPNIRRRLGMIELALELGHLT